MPAPTGPVEPPAVTPETMSGVPGSRLMLKAKGLGDSETQQRVREALAARGGDAARRANTRPPPALTAPPAPKGPGAGGRGT